MRSSLLRQRHEQDYEGLVRMLPYLHRLVDHLGETILTRTEARRIRAYGFEAVAGRKWRCPLLPDALVRDNPLFEHLSVSYSPSWRPRAWNPKRAQPLHRYRPPALTTIEQRMLNLLRRAARGQLSKRRLQQRLWRLPAKFLNHMIRSLASKGYLQWQGSHIWASGPSRQL